LLRCRCSKILPGAAALQEIALHRARRYRRGTVHRCPH
jgi:hypothetical protein